ncbi:MAG: MotA/TolQ/ExbB proton channel family protein [Phycisphaerales bacterium]|nr:MotA/TolQ/ExbB proton channel family protein [Phycisphaerales bacterium]
MNEMPSLGTIFFISYNIAADGSKQVEWIGSAIIWVLLLASVLNVSLIGWLRRRNSRASFMAVGKNSTSDLSRILRAGESARALGRDAVLAAAEVASEELFASRLRALEPLNILAQASPMVGLFGTVYGMILSFWSIATSGGNANPAILAGGIGTALVTTFWGLVVAIPALIAYASMRNTVDERSSESLDAALERLAKAS